jgi:hypothetical protein
MRILGLALVLVWTLVSFLPALAAVDHASCCKNCTNGYCLMDKQSKVESDNQPSCHHAQKKPKCEMKSTGCGHESVLKAFSFDAILPDPNLTSSPFYQENYSAPHDLELIHLANTLTPPPRSILL